MIGIDRSKLFIINVFFIYVILTYIPGLLLYPFFEERFHTYFSFRGYAFESFFIVFLIFLFSFSSIFYLADKIPRVRFSIFSRYSTNVFFIFITILFFISSLYFYKNYSISFRHKNRLSDAGLIVIFLFFVKYIVLVYTYLCLSAIMKGFELSTLNKWILFIMLISWIISINSSVQVIYVFLVLLMLFKPSAFCNSNSFTGLRGLFYLLVGVFCIALVFVMGVGNKVGLEFLFSNEGIEFLGGYIATVAARGSTSLYSLAMAYDKLFFVEEISFELIHSELYTFINRLSLYLPFGNFNSETIDTVSRFNYLLSFANHAERAGGTPGFLASVILSGSFPLGFIGMSIYLLIIVRVMSRPLSGIKIINPIALLIVVYFLLPFMENPIATVNFLNPSSFYFFSFVILTHLFSEKSFVKYSGG